MEKIIVGPDSALPYTFAGTVDRWIDGDTVWLNVTKDIGFRIVVSAHQDFRLFGINAPDPGQPLRDVATARVNALAPAGSPVNIETYTDPDDFGRWLARIWVGPIGTGLNINQTLLDEGLAVPYYGGKK